MRKRILPIGLLLTLALLVIANLPFLSIPDANARAKAASDAAPENSAGTQGGFDANSYYRLTTMWQGTSKSLDIVNDGKNNNQPILAKTADVSGQYWKITPNGNGYYRLTTMWQGDGKSLDIINDGSNNNQPILAATANVTGQAWKITPAANGYYRLTTLWQTDSKSLDIINDGKNNRVILAQTADVTGQYWRITKSK